jgi:hypothetical protein
LGNIDDHPYLACLLSVFNLQTHRGILSKW